jgi:hypothetical protein
MLRELTQKFLQMQLSGFKRGPKTEVEIAKLWRTNQKF